MRHLKLRCTVKAFAESMVPKYKEMYNNYNSIKTVEDKLYSLMVANSDLIGSLGGQLKTARTAGNTIQVAVLTGAITVLIEGQSNLMKMWDSVWDVGTATYRATKETWKAIQLASPQVTAGLSLPSGFPDRDVTLITPKIPMR